MTNIFNSSFDGSVCQGDHISGTHEGFTFRAVIERDDDMGAPWKEHDGHGPVSDWTARAKHAGERVLCSESRGGRKRYYDVATAIQLAHKDGWGTSDGRQEGETLRQYRARAVEKDFTFLKEWCDDEWFWCGVTLQVSYQGLALQACASLWGIDSCSGAYLTEVANELVEEALAEAREEMTKLTAAYIRQHPIEMAHEVHNGKPAEIVETDEIDETIAAAWVRQVGNPDVIQEDN